MVMTGTCYAPAFRPKSRRSIVTFDLLLIFLKAEHDQQNSVWPEREVEHNKW